jgi:hypothetical protein
MSTKSTKNATNTHHSQQNVEQVSRFYHVSKFLKCNVNMAKSTPLSQIPRAQGQQMNPSNNTDPTIIQQQHQPPQVSVNNDHVIINDEDDNINIEEVLQQEKMTNNNILSLQQQIESLKNEIGKKNVDSGSSGKDVVGSSIAPSIQPVAMEGGGSSSQQPSIITKDSLQGVLFHLKNLNYTNIIVTFALIFVMYSDYIDNFLLSKLGETKYEVGIPYIKALVVALIISVLYKN